MLSYEPGDALAHRLDPRAKLLFQAGVAVAAFARTDPAWLAGTALLGLAACWPARLSPLRVLRSYRVVLAVLALAPLLAGVALGPPWFRVGPALESLVAVARVVPVLLVSAAYVTTTPVRETRAAIQWLVPGRVGQALGVGVSLTVRFFPLVLRDVRATRTAITARLGDERPLADRARRLSVRSLHRTLDRSDRLALALRARCFAWNPTLPALSFGARDYPVLALGLALLATPLLGLL
ncbi:energy-coupling factor transporter transmembrane component T family protein [Halomicrobium salinisoli]|uniref:energy-coupling factor transporter transmembrane component T family protein n=1 Tax=Halomicrobium salinisoli TaxID=2878391 RepID=UPI001CF0896F|nr:energy-coupling factor transporter transmembrane component T [Halomicrobium salinisoli]